MSDVNPTEIVEARKELEAALQRYVRATRDLDNMFVQDYVLVVASESMEPGHENITYFNHINRVAMPIYAVQGLLLSAAGYYQRASDRNG